MAKSIEMMWKEGFVNETQLTIPKVNKLYERKSQNLVDKLRHMFSLNIKALIIGSIVMLILMSAIGAPFLGLYILCLLLPLIIIAKKELKKSTTLSKGQSSFDYLMSFDHWLKESISTYSTYYRVFYPMCFIGFATQGLLSDAGGKVIAVLTHYLPTEYFFLGQPYYVIASVVVITSIVAYFSDALYRLDLDLVYGRQFKKLEELIADMNELRN